MADETRNPFASVVAPSNSGALGGIFESIWGKPAALREQQMIETGRANARAEARATADAERTRTEAAAQGEREAQLEIMQLVDRKRRELGDVAPPKAVFSAVVADPTFARNAIRFPAERMTKLIQDIVGATSPPDPAKPITVGEGAAVIDPQTGRQIFKNEKPAEPDPYTKESRIAAARQGVGQMDKLSEAGQQARVDAIALDELDSLIGTATKRGKIATGMGAAIKGHLGRVGIALEGTDDVQALQSLIDRMTPAARQGLPGAASDRDVQMFRSSLPSLIRTPEGNREIAKRLRALNNHAIKQGEIAEQIFSGELTLPEGFKRLRNLRNPLEGIGASPKGDPSLGDPKLQETPVMRIRRNKSGTLEEYTE